MPTSQSCFLFLLTVFALAACGGPAEPVDLLLTNGRILTIDKDFRIVSDMAVRDGRIVETSGSSLTDLYNAEETVDLGGKTVMPGFIDSHTHVQGYPKRHIDLVGVESLEELLRLVTAKANELGPGEWITGYGWSEDELVERRRPLRDDLDEAAPENPVILTRAGSHSAVCNSLALELADVDRSTPDPDGGVIEKGPGGRLNGVIRETQNIVSRLVPKATAAEKRPDLIARLHDQFRHGITSIVQAEASRDDYAEWERIYSERGEQLPRAVVQILWPGAEPPELQTSDTETKATRDWLAEVVGRRTSAAGDRLKLGAIKLFVDGGFTGPAAYTIEPYKGQSSYRGKLNLTEDELRRAISEAHKQGWQLGIHAIGDAAIQLTVDLLAQALDANPREDHRHYLNHFTVRPPVETMAKMAKYGIAISQQPNFTYSLEGRYAANLDGERLATNNPLRSPIDAGIFLAISSDILPIGPPVGLYAAVTRKGMSGEVFGAGEALTIEEALTAYTRNGAWLTFEEESRGSLTVGRLADFIILKQDPLTMDPEELIDLTVERTYLGGKRVY